MNTLEFLESLSILAFAAIGSHLLSHGHPVPGGMAILAAFVVVKSLD